MKNKFVRHMFLWGDRMLRKLRQKLLDPVLWKLSSPEELVIIRHKEKHGVYDHKSEPQSPLVSSVARRKDIFFFSNWPKELAHDVFMHRKLWEWIYISQALSEKGMIQPEKRGLGFAVGNEPLPALFAKFGVKVTASDLDGSNPDSDNWKSNNECTTSLPQLERPDFCDNDTFYDNVSFMSLDMNKIPEELRNFDFCWSSCAFEHLGSVEKGREFVINSLKVLKPGGVAVHTTEYNISSEDSIDIPYKAVFGKNFFDELRDEVIAQGHYFAPLDYRLGNHPDDDHVPMQASIEDHLKLYVSGTIATSIGIIIVKGES